MAHHADLQDEKDHWEMQHGNSRKLKSIADSIEIINPVSQEFDDIVWIMKNKDKVVKMRKFIDLIQ